jgi:hypothetical protein
LTHVEEREFSYLTTVSKSSYAFPKRSVTIDGSKREGNKVVQWNSETDAIARWLDREDVKPKLLRVVLAWNGEELLGIDLADQLEKMVRSSSNGDLSEQVKERLDNVDWGHLAEHFAYEICGITEEELTRRYTEAGGT